MRAMDKCNEHSGVCAEVANLKEDMKNNVKKINLILYGMIANLATIVCALIIYIVTK
jgi:hypothetical protein